jgi:hypothetical protein
MKRNLLLLAVMILTVFAFSSLYAQCPQEPNDNGNCDTLFLETYGPDATYSAPGLYHIGFYIIHDYTEPADSLAAIILPFCFTSSNPAADCSVSAYWNSVGGANAYNATRGVFRDLPPDNNWMRDLYLLGNGDEWDNLTVNVTTNDHFWLSCIAGGADIRYADPAKRLFASIAFKLADSTMICLDSCFWPPSGRVAFTRGDAISYVPRMSWKTGDPAEGSYCHDFYIVPNQSPEFTGCPGTQNQGLNGSYEATGIAVNDPDCPDNTTLSSLTATFIGGGVVLGSFNPAFTSGGCSYSGALGYTVTDHCAAGGSVMVIATDSQGAADTCFFGINMTNEPPVVTCPGNQTLYVPGGAFNGAATATDANHDLVTFSGDPSNPAWVVVDANGAIHATPALGDTGIFDVCVIGTDACQAEGRCCFQIEVKPIVGVPNHVYIPISPCVMPGQLVHLPIIAENFQPGVCFGGFELEVEFDYTSMTFVGAEPGDLLQQGYFEVLGSDTTFYSWEYFNYRMLPCPLCACCKYKILLVGMKDLPNGPFHQGYCFCPTEPNGVIAYLNFVVNNNQNLQGLLIPVCFEWEGTVVNGVVTEDWDCAENTFSNCSGDTLFVSNKECEWMPNLCDDPGSITRLINFQTLVDCNVCGGVMVCPQGGEVCKRGDVNYNSLPYEVADAVLFARYFAEGVTVFGEEPDRSTKICATDVNADGRALTLSDLIYLIRVILHDAVEIPKLAPSSVANVIVSNGVITVEGANVGAILFEFDGAVNPTLLANGMDMVAGTNKVLVYVSPNSGQSLSAASEVLSYTGDAKLVSVEAVGYDTQVLTTTITAKAAPTTFALHAAYPNPFNPNTNLSFTLPEAVNYSLKIYNVAGQLVRAYQGIGSTGLNVINWDGRDNAGNSVSSGVYFYKLVAGQYSATEKMVMMK